MRKQTKVMKAMKIENGKPRKSMRGMTLFFLKSETRKSFSWAFPKVLRKFLLILIQEFDLAFFQEILLRTKECKVEKNLKYFLDSSIIFFWSFVLKFSRSSFLDSYMSFFWKSSMNLIMNCLRFSTGIVENALKIHSGNLTGLSTGNPSKL